MTGHVHAYATPHRPKRRSSDGRVFGIVVLTLGVGWFLDATGIWHMGWPTLLSFVLIALGVGMLFTARGGRHKWPTALGALLTVILLSSASIDLDFPGARGGVGEVVVQPRTAAAVRDSYAHKAGEFNLDLTRAPVPTKPHHIEVEQGAGEMNISLPESVPFEVQAKVAAGSIQLDDQEEHAFGVKYHFQKSYGEGDPLYVLHLEMGAGPIKLYRGLRPGGPPELRNGTLDQLGDIEFESEDGLTRREIRQLRRGEADVQHQHEH